MKYTFDTEEKTIKLDKNNISFCVDLGKELSAGNHVFTIKSFTDESDNTYNLTIVEKEFTINLAKLTTNITLELSSNELISGKNIILIPKVTDINENEVTIGTINIYDNMYANNDPIVSITAGETANFTDEKNYAETSHYLYAKYLGTTTEDTIYNPSPISAGVIYYKVYSNTLTLTANKTEIYAGESVDILATLTGGDGTISLIINNENNGTLTKDSAKSFTLTETGEYNFTASYTRSNDYFASCVSEQITVTVVEAPEIQVNIKLDNTSFSKNTTLTLTVNVTNKGEEISTGIVEIYNESDEKIGEINLTNTKEFKYNIKDIAGSHTIYAKYNQTTSDKKQYTVKDTLTITLTRNGEGIVKVNDTVNFNITYSKDMTENLELWINGKKAWNMTTFDTESIEFSDESDIGENNISIKFLGNDEFEASESNIVTINVVKALKTTVSLSISSSEVFSNVNFTITPTVADENGNNVSAGIVKIYTTPYYTSQDPIANVSVGESVEYADIVNNIGIQVFLYAVYMGLESEDIVYAQSPVSESVNYTVMGNTQLNLSVNGNSEVNIKEGTSIDILAELNGGNGNISLYINDEFNTTLTSGSVYSLTLPVGNYTLIANYTRGSDYYVSCLSNEVKVIVVENTTVNEVKVIVNDVTLPNQAIITVTATIDGVYEVDVNGTLLNISVSGGIGSENITLGAGEYYANITNVADANVENTVFKVVNPTIDENITIDVVLNSSNLKVTSGVANPSITLTLPNNATGTLKITVNGKTYSKTLANGVATITISDLSNGNYNAVVSYSGDSVYSNASTTTSIKVVKTTKITKLATKITAKKQTFKVKKTKKYTITLKTSTKKSVAKVTVYLKVKGKTYKAKTTSKGKATFKVKITKKGKYTAKITFKGNSKYKSSTKSVKFTVKR